MMTDPLIRHYRQRGHRSISSMAQLQMLSAKMGFGAFAPGAHKVIVQPRANGRTRNRNYTPRPLLHSFPAGLRCDPLDDLGHKAIYHLFFQHFTADVYPSGAGRGNPELGSLFVGVVLETINQTSF